LKGKNYFHEFQAGRGSSPFVGLLSRCRQVLDRRGRVWILSLQAHSQPSITEKNVSIHATRFNPPCVPVAPGLADCIFIGRPESPWQRFDSFDRRTDYRSREQRCAIISSREIATRLNRANHFFRNPFVLFFPSLFHQRFQSKVRMYNYIAIENFITSRAFRRERNREALI